MKLIAIPYAAGTSYAFRAVFKCLNPYVETDAFEYPGHGGKMWLPLESSIYGIAEKMLTQMFPICEPYCLLGYSMGGHVLCELYRLLLENHYPLPSHVFLCASDIPRQQPGEDLDTSDQVLQKQLTEMGGTAPEIMENAEFMEMLLPIFRADIIAERKYVLPYEPFFKCEGTVIVGETECKKINHFSEWQRYFDKPVRFRKVNGGHFFIQEDPDAFASILLSTIVEIKKKESRIQKDGGSGNNED